MSEKLDFKNECENCGHKLIHLEGCKKCMNCGWSVC